MADEKKFYVRTIGTDEIKSYPPETLEDAKKTLKECFDRTLANHDGGSWFYDKDLSEDQMSFQITGEEFYQDGNIRTVIESEGTELELDKIASAVNDGMSFANAYEYELQDMSGVYSSFSGILEHAWNAKMDHRAALEDSKWEMFMTISNAWYGKQCYFMQDNGSVYSRMSDAYMSREEAINEFIGKISE